MKTLPVFSSFSAGEVTQRVRNRQDVEVNRQGADTVRNYIATSHGPIERRGGSLQRSSISNAITGRMFGFQINRGTGFAVACTDDGNLTIYDQSGALVNAANNLLTNPEFNDVSGTPWVADPVTSVNIFRQGSVELRPSLSLASGIAQEVTGLTSGNIHQFTVVLSKSTPYRIKIGTALGLADILDQSHVNRASFVSFVPGVTAIHVAIEALAGDPRVLVGKAELLDMGVANPVITFVTGYDANDVELLQFAQPSGDFSMFFVTNRRPVKQLTYTFSTGAWAFADVIFVEPPAEWTGTNHPGAIVFYQGRMWLAGTPNEPEKLWASKPADFVNFTLGDGTLEDDSFEFELDFKGQIFWMAVSRDLLIGTENRELIATSEGGILKAGDIQVDPQSSFGSLHVQSLQVGEQIFFVSPDGRKIRETSFEFADSLHTSRDLTFFSEHITKDRRISGIVFQQNPDNIMWFPVINGDFLGMTFERSFDIIGWHRHDTDGLVKSFATLESFGDTELWMLVDRGNGGLEVEWHDTELFLDSAVNITNQAPSAAITVPHLPNKTVSIIADGAVHPDVLLDGNGDGTLNLVASQVSAGLGFRSVLKTLPVSSASTNQGSIRSQMKRWVKIFVSILESNVPIINGKRPADRTPSTPMGEKEPLTTQLIKASNLGYDRDGAITIEENLPVESIVDGIFGELSGDNL